MSARSKVAELRPIHRSGRRLLTLAAALAAIGLVATGAGEAPGPRAVDAAPVCGDANADRKLDISDAIRILNYVFQGGTPPRCIEPPPPADPATQQLEAWIAAKGIPILAVTSANVLALAGTELEAFHRAGIEPDPDAAFANVVYPDGTTALVPIVALASPLDLLHLALADQAEERGPGKLKIVHQNSRCTQAITCDPTCRPLLIKTGTHLKDEPVGEKTRKRCEKAESGTCEEWIDDVCIRTYYENDKCEKVIRSFTLREPVCE